ncbi:MULTISPECIES: hypothetical protein [Streptomonospora]|uniref:Uncharacterized protein n=2 Tax=Streptomonospora TaxID=104204 RepID=A0ABV9SR14_9ACTN
MKSLRRLFARPGPSEPAVPAAVPHQCQNCGSPRLFREKASFTAVHSVSASRSISRPFEPTQIHCRKCDFLVCDDLYGDGAAAYAQLAAQAGARRPRIAAQVAEAVRAAERLPALSDAQRRRGYDRIRQAWGCAGMRTVPADGLRDTLTRIARGYFAEGSHQVSVQTVERTAVDFSFITATGWRPVRLVRTADGDFAVYGQIQLYRILDAA